MPCGEIGAGLVGNGCVGHACSPSTSLAGAGRSSIGQTGAPVTRSNTNTNPCFVSWTTAVDRAAVDLHRDDRRRRRGVVVPQAVMRDLEVPLQLARRRIEAHDRIAVQILPGPPRAVEVVARRADRQIHQPASIVEAHRRPHVRVARELPRLRAPRLDARLALVGHGVEAPHLPPGLRVERAHVTRRILLVRQPVADAIAENDEVLVDDRRRRVRVALGIDRPAQALRRDRRHRARRTR